MAEHIEDRRQRTLRNAGGYTLTGTWVIRWDALPPTLVLHCTTSDFRKKDPKAAEYDQLGKDLEVKILRLDIEGLTLKYPDDRGALSYERPAAEPAPPAKVADALPPAVPLTEAIRLAESHVKAEKIETAGHFVSSVQLLQTEGKVRWEVRWDGTDRLAKGDWFIIRVGMDKQAEIIHGL